MIKREIKNWYQVEIKETKDVDVLSGENLNNIISLISDHLKIQYVVIDDLDGPFGIDILKHQFPKILSLKQFVKIFKRIPQFEWGYFHLFSSKGRARYFIEQNKLIYESISFTDAVVSVFDGMSFIIYTNSPEIIGSIGIKYPTAKINKRTVEQLEFYG